MIHEHQVVGMGPRPDGWCPHCWSMDRVRHTYLYLRDHTDVFERHVDLLHIAPELSLGSLLGTMQNITYLSGDFDPKAAMRQIDLTDTGLPDESFDVVICSHVLEHIPDDRRAMREVRRILRPNGLAILQVPISFVHEQTIEDESVTDAAERERQFGQIDHVRIYGRDYVDRLQDAGFSVEQRNLTRENGSEFGARFGLLADEELFVCTPRGS